MLQNNVRIAFLFRALMLDGWEARSWMQILKFFLKKKNSPSLVIYKHIECMSYDECLWSKFVPSQPKYRWYVN